MYCGTARTATLGRLFRSAPYYLRAGVTLILGPTLTLIRPSSGRRHTRTSENAVKRKFVENLFCVGWVNRGKRKAGLLQEGGIRSVRLNSGVDCNRGANKRILQMRDFSQRGGRGPRIFAIMPGSGSAAISGGGGGGPSLTPIERTYSSVYHPFGGWEDAPSVPFPAR